MTYRPKVAFSKSKLRSAITNGSAILATVDHRLPEMRRLRDLVEDLSAELGGNLSPSEQVMVRRASMLSLLAELFERSWARGWEKQGWKVPATETLSNYVRTTNALRRVLDAAGLPAQPPNRIVNGRFDNLSADEIRALARERGLGFIVDAGDPLRRPTAPNAKKKEGTQ